jgi:integrase
LLDLDGPYQRSLEARGIVNTKKVMSVLRRGLAKHANIDVARLTRRDLVETLDALNDRPGARRELKKHLRVLLEWCVNAGLAPGNAIAGWRAPPKSRSQRLEEASKRRALDDDAIAKVWCAAERHGQYGSIVRLALLTAMRRSELAHLRWNDVIDDRLIVVPERAKTGTQHEIPLTSMMRDIIARQPRTISPLLFPGRVKGKPLDGWSLWKKALVTDAGAGHFTLHDCRRTCRTLMSRLNVAENIAELAIGHTPKGLIGVYDRAERWVERREAFERVGNHIAGLIRK